MEVGEAIAVLVFGVLIVVVFLLKEQRLQDPTNKEMVYADQMRGICNLRAGPVSAALFRQSGNLYRDLGFFEGRDAAFSEIEKSFRRAKIDSVYIQRNTNTEFEVLRLHHSHGGKAEGKKLGGARIVATT